MKTKRIFLMALIIILILAALLAIYKLASGLLFDRRSQETPVVYFTPEPEKDPVQETAVPSAQNSEPEELENAGEEAQPPEEVVVEITPVPAVAIETEGDLEIIIPDDQDSAGE